MIKSVLFRSERYQLGSNPSAIGREELMAADDSHNHGLQSPSSPISPSRSPNRLSAAQKSQ
jgi:hypothetical protein